MSKRINRRPPPAPTPAVAPVHSYTIEKLNIDAVPGEGVQVLRLPVDAAAGDVLIAMASQVFTTKEEQSNALTWCDLFLSQDPAAIAAASEDLYFASQGGTNITPAEHHFLFVLNGAVTVPSTGTWYAILSVYWDEDLSLPGRIEQGANYGKLDVVAFR